MVSTARAFATNNATHTSPKPGSRELTRVGTSAHSRQHVKVDCFRVAYQPGVVNTPFLTNVYHFVGILREWPGPATKVTCSRQAWDQGL
jgi:hypothetical protein